MPLEDTDALNNIRNELDLRAKNRIPNLAI